MSLDVPDHVLTVNRQELARFFLVFARFEFACKVEGARQHRRYGSVEVDWDLVAQWMEEGFFTQGDNALADAIAYLEEHPPKMETYRGDARWVDRKAKPTYSRERALLFYVQGVRNNLMHGGKFSGNTDPDRDVRLLEASLKVIEACLRCSPNAHAVFMN